MSVDVLEIAAGGLTFRGHAAGPRDGRLVLLLHGFPQGSFQWRHQMAALAAAGYRAVAFDQRGYSPGARPPGRRSYTLDRVVGDVLALAADAGVDRFHLVGHDWGGAVAWALAATGDDPFSSWGELVVHRWWPVGPVAGRLVVTCLGRSPRRAP